MVKKEGDELVLGKQQFHAVALAPTSPGLSDLHDEKHAELMRLVKEADIEVSCDLNNNASMGFVAQSRLPLVVASRHDRTQGREDVL